MNPGKLWLPVLTGLACLALLSGSAAAQPMPIGACGTTIGTPGSYVVTANLTATSTAAPCIKVTVPAVTIDLDGFVLSGVGGSPGIAATTGPLTITNGVIKAFKVGVNAPVIGVTVSDLQVTGSQGAGAVLGDDAQAKDDNFFSNGTSGTGDGLDVGSNALITKCTFISNKGNGLRAKGGGAVVTRSRAAGNTADGFLTHGNSVLRNNTATGNAGLGFQSDLGGSAFRSNVASSNGRNGIEVFQSALIGNNASENKNFGFADDGASTFEGNTASNNTFDGFVSSDLSTFVNNTASLNGRYGFNLLCPDNLINDTAEFNKTKNINFSNPGCQLINALQ